MLVQCAPVKKKKNISAPPAKVGRVEALAVSPFAWAHGGALEGMNAGRELLGSGNEHLDCRQ